jgi:pyruvate dehydrogenase E1 component beta subunit
VAELMFADFVGVSMDQIFNQMAKFRYMFGGKTRCPAVVRLAMGAGMNMGAQHSQSIYALLTAVPGLKVVVPSNAYDAKGLLIQAIRDDDPVMFFEHKALYPRKGEVPDGAYTVPFGEASLLREGEHVTVVAIGRMVVFAEKVVDTLAQQGITCDLIDPRTTSPLDAETILESVESTGRLVVVDESNPRCSVAADICAIVAEQGFHSLKAAPRMVTAPHSPVPFARELERAYVPGPARIEAAIREVMQG